MIFVKRPSFRRVFLNCDDRPPEKVNVSTMPGSPETTQMLLKRKNIENFKIGKLLQGGPLPVISGVISPING